MIVVLIITISLSVVKDKSTNTFEKTSVFTIHTGKYNRGSDIPNGMVLDSQYLFYDFQPAVHPRTANIYTRAHHKCARHTTANVYKDIYTSDIED